MRDDFTALIMGRKHFVDKWCEARGKHRDTLTMAEILEIRRDPRWINPTADEGAAIADELVKD